MAKIGVIGTGFVGGATMYGFENKGNHEVFGYDKYKESKNSANKSLEQIIKNVEFIFLCVPTPTTNGEIDLSIIYEVLDEITSITNNTDKIIIIKSSIVPGTTKQLSFKYPESNICVNPEFLCQKNAKEDFLNAKRTVIGADNEAIRDRVKILYSEEFPNTPVFAVDSISAELVKYMSNCLLATKVIFANEMYDLCEHFDIEYNPVKEMVMADTRMGSHLDVTEQRGFGGICFPKDIVALINVFDKQDISADLLKAVWAKNQKIRKEKDWEDSPYAINE